MISGIKTFHSRLDPSGHHVGSGKAQTAKTQKVNNVTNRVWKCSEDLKLPIKLYERTNIF